MVKEKIVFKGKSPVDYIKKAGKRKVDLMQYYILLMVKFIRIGNYLIYKKNFLNLIN